MKKQKIIIALLSLTLLLAPAVSMGRGLVPCGGYKADGSLEPVCTVNDFFALAAKLIGFLIAVSGIYAVFWIVVNGIRMVLSQGNEEALSKAKGGLTNAVIGFFIVIISFAIVNTLVKYVFQVPVDLTNPQCYINSAACK